MSIGVRDEALVVASICAVLSILISASTIGRHLCQTRHPALRLYTIRILFMVPVYSVDALAALYAPSWNVVLTVARSSYEAVALFSFVQLMLSYLTLEMPSQGDGTTGAVWLSFALKGDPQIHHPVPCCWSDPWPMGPVFLRRCLVGVFQYTAVMPFVTLLTGISQISGVYGEWDNFSSAYPYLAFVQNASQCWALYCLVLFYKATASRLEDVRPLGKFLSIKFVVFITWWQGLLISALSTGGIIKGQGGRSSEAAVNSSENTIICFEMLAMAEIFALVFPPSDYAISHKPRSDSRSGSRYVHQSGSGLGASLIQRSSSVDVDPEV